MNESQDLSRVGLTLKFVLRTWVPQCFPDARVQGSPTALFKCAFWFNRWAAGPDELPF